MGWNREMPGGGRGFGRESRRGPLSIRRWPRMTSRLNVAWQPTGRHGDPTANKEKRETKKSTPTREGRPGRSEWGRAFRLHFGEDTAEEKVEKEKCVQKIATGQQLSTGRRGQKKVQPTDPADGRSDGLTRNLRGGGQ